MALSKRVIKAPLIFHSDRGIEYSCHAFVNTLNQVSFATQSMSRTGNCWDNAVAESFFKTLKTEIGSNYYASYSDTIATITDYITNWYNTKRIHSSLDYQSPKMHSQ
jgi:transposase InsO family protein